MIPVQSYIHTYHLDNFTTENVKVMSNLNFESGPEEIDDLIASHSEETNNDNLK